MNDENIAPAKAFLQDTYRAERLSAQDLVTEDLRHIWHPATQMKECELYPPLPIVRAQGAWLYTADGRRILDIISSWWCNLLGHCHPKISAALSAQAHKLEHVIFAGFTHPLAVELANRLCALLPEGLRYFNFADNGSSAVEIALKMAFQYQMQRGQSGRVRFACLTEGYHGETIGALAVGSMDLYSRLYRPLMTEQLHVTAPDCLRCPCGQKRGQCECQCLRFAKEALAEHGSELAAFIVEPLLQGAAGMRIYPERYLQGLAALCREHDVLLIADEIATGFGRTGAMFACEKAGITPDLMTLSKGMTGGYLPMSVVCTTQEIYEAFYADYESGKAFMHSHTYAGNPLGCACALAVLDVLEQEEILERSQKMALYLTELMRRTFNEVPYVAEIRQIGLICAVELCEDTQSLKAFKPELRLGRLIYQEALERGLLLRNIGDVIYFNPPLNIQKDELDFAAATAKAACEAVFGRLGLI